VESAALLVDEVLPEAPMRQRVLSVPFPLRYLFARDPIAMGEALGIVHFRHLHNFFGSTKPSPENAISPRPDRSKESCRREPPERD
jgi:hypothetical protein